MFRQRSADAFSGEGVRYDGVRKHDAVTLQPVLGKGRFTAQVDLEPARDAVVDDLDAVLFRHAPSQVARSCPRGGALARYKKAPAAWRPGRFKLRTSVSDQRIQPPVESGSPPVRTVVPPWLPVR